MVDSFNNTTGLPDTDSYVVGRGILYIASLDANGKPLGYRDVGNAPKFTLAVKTDFLDHVSSRAGLATVDKRIVKQITVNLQVTLDEINKENLKLALAGSDNNPTNAAIAGWANYTMIPAPGVELGKWYDLIDSTGKRAYDIDAANVTMKKTGAGGNYVLTSDYLVDTKFGRVFFLSNPSSGANQPAAGDTVDVALAADADAAVLTSFAALTTSPLGLAVKFIGDNPASNDKQIEVECYKVRLVANGNIDLIGDKYAELALEGLAEASTYDVNAPYFRITSHVNT